MRRKGFTLIELLVVIAIIVVLIAMLVPSLERAMSAAQRASCMANMDGIGNAIEFYLMDYKRAYPDGARPGSGSIWGPDGRSRPPQQVLIDAKLLSVKIFTCPTDPSPQNFHWWRYHYYKGNIPSYIRDDEVEDSVFVSEDGPPYNGIENGCSYMVSEEAAYNERENSGSTIFAGQIIEPQRWAYMSDGAVAINGNTWRVVDPQDPVTRSGNANDIFNVRVRWNHLKTITMLIGDKSVVSVEQYTPDGDVDPIAYRFRSDPYDGKLPQYGWPARYTVH